MRILCYIVAYDAAPFIGEVLARIPAECWDHPDYRFEALVSDDCSKDDMFKVATELARRSPHAIMVSRTVRNLGLFSFQIAVIATPKTAYSHADAA